jgi:hypothetical protein
MACSSPNSPKGVAKSFWDGVLAQDQDAARKYVSAATQNAVDFSKNTRDWKVMKVELGTTDMSGNEAMVHTIIVDQSTNAKYAFNTYLVQENGVWRVDYLRTRKASITSEIFSDIISSLDRFNKGLTNDFDNTIAGFREAAPQIKVELDQLTQTLADHMKEASKQSNPAVHQKIEDFKSTVMGIFAHHPSHAVIATPAPAQNQVPAQLPASAPVNAQ